VSKITFHSLFRKITGQKTIVVNDASTVRDVIEALSVRYGEDFRRKVISPEGDLNKFVAVFLNNSDVRTLEGLPTPVREDDVIAFLPAVAGG
jgi:MoaD family protein